MQNKNEHNGMREEQKRKRRKRKKKPVMNLRI